MNELGPIVPHNDGLATLKPAPQARSRAAGSTVARPKNAPLDLSALRHSSRGEADRAAGSDQTAAWPTVAGYEIISEVGRGNMGVVYRARQLSLDRLVALKMVRTGAHAGQQELKRFLLEAQVVAQLRHPSFVQIYEIGVQDGLPFFSMELLEGGNLKDKLAGRPLPWRQAARLMATVAQAMGVAHQNGIVHRDLKPANILLSPAGSSESCIQDVRRHIDLGDADFNRYTPKIADFGLAKQLWQDGSQTESGVVMGTPNYMAPEQAEGKSRAVGTAADVYGLGAILYELCTGQPPYNAESPAETILQMFRREPIAPSQLQPKIPRDLDTICLKCLQREIPKRYRTAQELAEDLERFLAGEPIAARPASTAERIWKWSRRHPALGTLASCAILALFALTGLGIWHNLDLQDRLTQARADERAARAAEEAATREARVAELRAQAKELLRAGQQAMSAKDWRTAQMQLQRARDKIGTVAELSELQPHADQLLHQASQQVADRETYQSFLRYRDEALFHAALFTGTDLGSALEKTRGAALTALKLYGVNPDSDRKPALDETVLSVQEKADVGAACYELLLVLAEAVAQPLPRQAEDAVRRQARAALDILAQAAAIAPPSKAHYLQRAQYLAQAGDLDAARAERERAQHVQPANALDCFLVGNEKYRRGNSNEAIEHLEKAVQLQPEYFWAQYYLGLCGLKTGRASLATMAFTACLSRRPDFAWLYLLRGSAWAERGDFAEAETDFREALKHSLDDPGRYGLLVNRGVLRIRQGRLAEARADLQRAIALKPKLYQGYVNLAQVCVKENKLDEAVSYLDRAVQLEPDVAALYRTRARLQMQRQKFADALADLDRAVTLAAGQPSAAVADDQLERGRLLRRGHDYNRALRAYDAALQIKPKNAVAHFLRAEALVQLKRVADALAALDAGIALDRGNADLFRTRAALRARLGRYPEALADYTKALELAPDAATYAGRGWAFLVTEAHTLALADFEQAIRLDGNDGNAYAGRGLLLVLQGKVRDGIRDGERAVHRGPVTARLLYNAARIYAQAARDPDQDVRASFALQERALELLHQALDMVPAAERSGFWARYVQHDTALNPIRTAPRFRQLAGRFLAQG